MPVSDAQLVLIEGSKTTGKGAPHTCCHPLADLRARTTINPLLASDSSTSKDETQHNPCALRRGSKTGASASMSGFISSDNHLLPFACKALATTDIVTLPSSGSVGKSARDKHRSPTR